MSSFFEALFLAAALCADGFTAAFVYGSDRVEIPALSVFIITVLSTAFLMISLLLGDALRPWLPAAGANGFCAAVLIFLGIAKFTAAPTKDVARRANRTEPEKLSPKEAAALGTALSLDSAAAGTGAGAAGASLPLLFLLSLVFCAGSILSGALLGRRAASLFRADFSRLSGGVLILLGLFKLM